MTKNYLADGHIVHAENETEALAVVKHLYDHEPEHIYQAWSTSEMTAEFEVQAFVAPFVTVMRRSDGVHGTLQFDRFDDTRYYFAWVADQ